MGTAQTRQCGKVSVSLEQMIPSSGGKTDPSSDHLINRARNVFSQHGEDGILEELLRRMDIACGVCCEFGAWDGIHLSNCRNLILQGWSALMIEGDSHRFKDLVLTYTENPKVCCVNRFIGCQTNTVDQTCGEAGHQIVDFLSVDIDGLDCEILESLKMRPRIICIETSGGFPPEYDRRNPPELAKNNLGQSLRVMTDVAAAKNYDLVCYTGNAFFVLKSDVKQFALAALTPVEAYNQWLFRLNKIEREWLYMANLGLVTPYHCFNNCSLSRKALNISLLKCWLLWLQFIRNCVTRTLSNGARQIWHGRR